MTSTSSPPNRSELAALMKEALDLEARRNELSVGVVRVSAYACVAGLDAFLYFRGIRPAAYIASSLAWASISGLLLLAIAKLPYGRVYWLIVPAVDCFLIDRLLRARIAEMGITPAMASISALACGLFAATGGIRFDRRAAAWTTLLAVVLLYRLLGDRASHVHLLYSGVGIAAIGMLNFWMAEQVRRSMESTRGQLLLERLLPGVAGAAFKDPLSLLDAPRVVEATLLVTDLRGFTTIAEKMEPGDVFELLNRLQGALAEAVHECGGIVDKFMGDGMLAVFGATDPSPDHARRAIDAVTRIRQALSALNRELPEEGLRIGIGVHSGSVVAGCLGGGSRLEFTVIGDAVNMTSRLEALTKEKNVDVLVSEETAKRVPSAVLVDLGVVAVRGRQQGIRVFTIQ